VIFRGYINREVKKEMDKEMREYLDRRLLVLATKDDVEKLRQETKGNIRQLKEEDKANINEWRQDIKAEIEQLRMESKGEIDPLHEKITEGLQELRREIQSLLDQSNQAMKLLLQQVREEGTTNISHSREETKVDLDRLREGVDGLRGEIKQMAKEVAASNEKIKAGFMEVKDELGSMIKLSYADLEKRFNALEARVKALEKMVLP